MPLSNEEVLRYARHIILPEVGGRGQQALKEARLLIAGLDQAAVVAGLYLAAAGVGSISLCDPDGSADEEPDPARAEPDLARWAGEHQSRAEAVAAKLRAVNPAAIVHVLPSPAVEAVDLVLWFAGALALPVGVPVVTARVRGAAGSLTVIPAGEAPPPGSLGDRPEPDLAPGAEPAKAPDPAARALEAAAAGVIGSAAATEAVKVVLGRGRLLTGRLLRYDALRAAFREE
jgi:molybdopterin-synthase adenylyltransferase